MKTINIEDYEYKEEDIVDHILHGFNEKEDKKTTENVVGLEEADKTNLDDTELEDDEKVAEVNKDKEEADNTKLDDTKLKDGEKLSYAKSII